MSEYDEPLEELQEVPTIVIDRLHRGRITTIRQAMEWLKVPHGLAITGEQVDLLRKAVHDWEHGIQRSDTD